MISLRRFAVIVKGLALVVVLAASNERLSQATAQLQPCTFGPSRPLTEATIFDRQPRVSISALCPLPITQVAAVLDGRPVPVEHTGLNQTRITVSFRPAEPLPLGIHIVNIRVEGSVFSWGFTVADPSGSRWLTLFPGSPGAQAACPRTGREWVFLYWDGEPLTSIDAAASLCPNADRFWVNRDGRWLGYAPDREEVSEHWVILNRGEAHFLRGRP